MANTTQPEFQPKYTHQKSPSIHGHNKRLTKPFKIQASPHTGSIWLPQSRITNLKQLGKETFQRHPLEHHNRLLQGTKGKTQLVPTSMEPNQNPNSTP
jgi:hypothetical protein